MHLAAENGHANIIELLADKFRASIFERTKDGSTLMHIASLNGHAECAMMLFKKGVYLHMPNKVTHDQCRLVCPYLSILALRVVMLVVLHAGRRPEHPHGGPLRPRGHHQHAAAERRESGRHDQRT